ncbi:chemotaxis protein CheA [Aeribacillus pallidus]|uniref:Chemotaxis protein CheA n=1 Tax=Aeribacillus pallidus TaxID=33936 RepID=A0A223E8I1_9BACI|nr:chemotaxis protein CheA [Aeribacillus pallidus]ASS91539.1 chemotaxis protein CheA [Aeribacillus pallidus]
MEMNQYLDIFIEESKEHLQSCNEKLLELEQNPDDLGIVNEIFRSAHTLKGMGATMGFEDLADLTHKIENVFDAIRNQKLEVTPEIMDVLFEALENLEEIVLSIADGGDGKKDVSAIVKKLQAIESGEQIEDETAENETSREQVQDVKKLKLDEYDRTVILQSIEQGFQVYEINIRLREDCILKAARAFMIFELLEKHGEVVKSSPSVDLLEEEKFDNNFSVAYITKEDKDFVRNSLLKISEVEEVLVEKVNVEKPSTERVQQSVSSIQSNASQQTAASKQTTVSSKQSRQQKDSSKDTSQKQKKNQQKTIRVNIERLDILMNLFEELVIDKGRLEQISKELNHSELKETVEKMSRVSADLQNIILNMRMIPIETVFNRFPRMVRNLARDLNKKINLVITGAETELDRTVIDEIGDPLVHLIRNAIDHGIETPETRLKYGKKEEGTLRLSAYHSGNHVFIEIEDDGAGINQKKVLQKAIERGIVTKEASETLTEKQIHELIFASGFSTAEKISDVSGRGVGLDVVKNTIESLGGSITIESEEGKGSLFSIQLPLTLTIISAMLIEVGNEKYGIPISSIIESLVIKKEDILQTHQNKVIDYRGKIVPLVFLKEIFEVDAEDDQDYVSIVVVKKGDKMAGLVVDSFIGQQEIVLKSLGQYLTNVFAISGATILGDGQVALIVDCNALIQ